MLWLGVSTPAFLILLQQRLQKYRLSERPSFLWNLDLAAMWVIGCKAALLARSCLISQSKSTDQFYVSKFCCFFDMSFLCVDILDISKLNPYDSPKLAGMHPAGQVSPVKTVLGYKWRHIHQFHPISADRFLG